MTLNKCQRNALLDAAARFCNKCCVFSLAPWHAQFPRSGSMVETIGNTYNGY